MEKHSAEYITSSIGSFIFGVLYGVLECYMDWRKVEESFSWIEFKGFNAYHFFILLPLFLLIGFYPLIDDLILKLKDERFVLSSTLFCFGNVILSLLVEDITVIYLTYGGFYLDRAVTSQLLGIIKVGGLKIPLTYIIAFFLILILYTASLKMKKRIKVKVKDEKKIIIEIFR